MAYIVGMLDLDNYSTGTKVLALCRFAGIGPRVFAMLLTRFGSLDNILLAEAADLGEIENMTDELMERIDGAADHLPAAEAEQKALQQRDIIVTTRFDESYPPLLNELNDPPPLLYVRGRLPEHDARTVTLVGATEASNEGIELTVQLAKQFGVAGVQVVSSLRIGIDAAVHLGSKAAESSSFAVLDSGFDHIESTAEMPLAIDAVKEGGVISEYPPGTPADDKNFRDANRILVGLGQAVVVTEVYETSAKILDLILFCQQIGKIVFLMIDPAHGPLSDKATLDKLTGYGVIPIIGFDRVKDIIASLV